MSNAATYIFVIDAVEKLDGHDYQLNAGKNESCIRPGWAQYAFIPALNVDKSLCMYVL